MFSFTKKRMLDVNGSSPYQGYPFLHLPDLLQAILDYLQGFLIWGRP
jgi:hypothetical protein